MILTWGDSWKAPETLGISDLYITIKEENKVPLGEGRELHLPNIHGLKNTTPETFTLKKVKRAEVFFCIYRANIPGICNKNPVMRSGVPPVNKDLLADIEILPRWREVI